MGAYLQSRLPKLYSMDKMFEKNSSSRISHSKSPIKRIVREEETSHSPEKERILPPAVKGKKNLTLTDAGGGRILPPTITILITKNY